MVRNAANQFNNSRAVNSLQNVRQKVDNVFTKATELPDLKLSNVFSSVGKKVASSAGNSLFDDAVAQAGRNYRDDLRGKDVGLLDQINLPDNLAAYILHNSLRDQITLPFMKRNKFEPVTGTALVPYNPYNGGTGNNALYSAL